MYIWISWFCCCWAPAQQYNTNRQISDNSNKQNESNSSICVQMCEALRVFPFFYCLNLNIPLPFVDFMFGASWREMKHPIVQYCLVSRYSINTYTNTITKTKSRIFRIHPRFMYLWIIYCCMDLHFRIRVCVFDVHAIMMRMIVSAEMRRMICPLFVYNLLFNLPANQLHSVHIDGRLVCLAAARWRW